MTRSSHRTSALREVLRPRLHALILDLWSREAAARDFSDPEGVHQMRVASRKLRAALQAGEGALTRKRERQVYDGVRHLARALGAVRDGDVMIADLGGRTPDGAEHPGIERLVARLEDEREVNRARMLHLLDTLDASGFREASISCFREGKESPPKKLRRRDAQRLVKRPHARFVAITGDLPTGDNIEGLHRLRIAAKSLRYVLQLAEPALAPQSTALLEPLGAMQDHLGDIHNDDVLLALIRGEIHSLVDAGIDDAISGETASVGDTSVALNDLMDMVIRVSRDRHARYAAFVQWWDDKQGAGITEAVHAVADPGRKKTRKG